MAYLQWAAFVMGLIAGVAIIAFLLFSGDNSDKG
jgi:hypothetical protein